MYSSLFVQSCQGMEMSHHAAKAANQQHTQHGGGRKRKNALLQQYEHWYRNIQHRITTKARLKEAQNVVLDPAEVDATESQCVVSKNSNAGHAYNI